MRLIFASIFSTMFLRCVSFILQLVRFLDFMYLPTGVQYYQPQQVYPPTMFTQSAAPISAIPHPQTQLTPYNQSIMAAPVQTQQLPPIPQPSQTSKGKTLNIIDPTTGEKLDMEQFKNRKKSISEAPSSIRVSEASVPVTIRTPPPKGTDVKSAAQSNFSENVATPQTPTGDAGGKAGFSISSDDETASEDVPCDNDVLEEEVVDEAEEISESESSNEASDTPNQEFSEDDKSKSSSSTEGQSIDFPPQPIKKIEKVGSDCGNILKYNREQLISIRSAADLSMLPEPPKSVVSNTGPNTLRHRRQAGHRPQSRRVLTFNTDAVVLDEVENAYKPSHMKKESDLPQDRITQLTRELNIILNRLLDENVAEVADDIKKLLIKGDDEVSCLIKAIMNKASRQPKYSEAFAKLCKMFIDAKMDNFRKKLMKAANEHFSTPLQAHIDKVNADINEKIESCSDEKVKKVLEEDRESHITKKREAYFGVIQFFSHLFVQKVIPNKSFAESLKPFVKPKNQDDVLALLTCLTISGPMLDERKANFIGTCINGLEMAKKSLNLEQYVLYKIISLLELRERKWRKLEVASSSQSSTLPRTNSAKDNVFRQQSHIASRQGSSAKLSASKLGDSKNAIDIKHLAVSNSGTRSSYLGPHYDWSQGSKAQTK